MNAQLAQNSFYAEKVRPWLMRALRGAILSVFFFAAWWSPLVWSSDLLQTHFEFLILIPAVLAIVLWVLKRSRVISVRRAA